MIERDKALPLFKKPSFGKCTIPSGMDYPKKPRYDFGIKIHGYATKVEALPVAQAMVCRFFQPMVLVNLYTINDLVKLN